MLVALPSIKEDLIRLQLWDITDTPGIESGFRTPTLRSSLWDFATTLVCILSGAEPARIYTWQFGDEGGKKEELALPSSESRTEMEFFFFFFLILFPFPSYHIQLSNSILCKAFSGTGMCVWWINQQTLKKKKKNCCDCKLLCAGRTLSKVWAITFPSQRSCFLHPRMWGIGRGEKQAWKVSSPPA